MSRTWNDALCPDCGEAPKPTNDGILRCACGNKKWERVAGIEGTPTEAEMLKAHGFWFARSANGDAYYVGSFNRLVWLYDDGTWSCNPGPPKAGMNLEDYLKETDHL